MRGTMCELNKGRKRETDSVIEQNVLCVYVVFRVGSAEKNEVRRKGGTATTNKGGEMDARQGQDVIQSIVCT